MKKRAAIVGAIVIALLLPILGVDGRNESAAAQTVSYDASIDADLAANGEVEIWVEFVEAIAPGGDHATEVEALKQHRDGVLAELPSGVEVLTQLNSVPFARVMVSSEADLASILEDPSVTNVHVVDKEPLLPDGYQEIDDDLPHGYQVDGLDPLLNQARPAIDANQLHSRGIKGQGVRVAILDTGIDNQVPDLKNHLVYERCVLRAHADPCPNGNANTQTGPGAAKEEYVRFGTPIPHGTWVAGTITSTGVNAPVGIAPSATIEMYKVFGDGFPSDTSGAQTADLIEALDHIWTRNTADIVNMSLGGGSYTSHCNTRTPAMTSVVNKLRGRDILVVASSGNSAFTNSMGFPACIENVMSVTASENATPQLAVWGFGSGGNISATTDVSAPGTAITTTGTGTGTGTVNGTSFSAPIVAACAALFISDGTVGIPALEGRIFDSVLFTTGGGHSAPWINCGDKMLCDGWVPTVDIGSGGTPTNGPDVIWGTPFADVIGGGGGDDIICGRGGPDTLKGGLGHDRIFGGEGADSIKGGKGHDYLRGQNGNDTVSGESGNDTVFGNNGNDNVNGGDGDDYVAGNRDKDTVTGGDGTDTVNGGGHNDIVKGGAGPDTVSGNGGSDDVYGGSGNDPLLSGGDGNDFVTGEDGNDIIRGNRGNDVLWGGAGNDKLYGFTGNDELVGGSGNDRLDGESGWDTCDGRSGNDTGPNCESKTAIP